RRCLYTCWYPYIPTCRFHGTASPCTRSHQASCAGSTSLCPWCSSSGRHAWDTAVWRPWSAWAPGPRAGVGRPAPGPGWLGVGLKVSSVVKLLLHLEPLPTLWRHKPVEVVDHRAAMADPGTQINGALQGVS